MCKDIGVQIKKNINANEDNKKFKKKKLFFLFLKEKFSL